MFQVPPPIRLGGSPTKSQYQYTLQDSDTAELYKYAPILEGKIRELPEVQDVTSDMQLSNPQLNVTIDRDRASALGISTQKIEDALYTAYGTRQISTIYAPTNQYQVIMELAPDSRPPPRSRALRARRVGNLVPLSAGLDHAGDRAADGRAPGPGSRRCPSPSTCGRAWRSGTRRGGQPVARQTRRRRPDQLQGHRAGVPELSAGLGLLLLVAIVVIYMVLGSSTRLHPPADDSDRTALRGVPARS